jgi:catechol 2,3-dioxygenase-like lactoylglutathione lyase family enzyme
MPVRPQFALIVSNITASLKFYISYLGFTAVESQPESGMATMLDKARNQLRGYIALSPSPGR